MLEKGVSHIAYFRLDGGSSKLYTQEYVDEKDKEIKRLKEEYVMLQNASDKVEEEKDREIERLNNDIKVLLKENENKEKVIKAQDNIINELEKDIKNLYTYGIKNNREQKDYLLNRLECLKELKGSNKE